MPRKFSAHYPLDKQIRWKQRFNNFENVFLFLEEALKKDYLSRLEEAGIIQSYEFTFELSWKTLKDFLETMGSSLNFPREIIKEAFHTELLQNGHLWIEMLKKRNILSHTYNQELATNAISLIRNRYCPEIKKLYLELKSRCLD